MPGKPLMVQRPADLKQIGGGRPPGAQNKGKPFRKLLAEALEANDNEKLKKLVAVLIKLGLAGNVAAIKEIGDRMDGRVPIILHNDNDKPMFLNINWLATPRPPEVAPSKVINEVVTELPNPLPAYQPNPDNAALEGDEQPDAEPGAGRRSNAAK